MDKFTRQAVPFSQMPAHFHEESNQLVLAAVAVPEQFRSSGSSTRNY